MVDKRLHYVGVISLSVFGGKFCIGLGTLRTDQCPLFLPPCDSENNLSVHVYS